MSDKKQPVLKGSLPVFRNEGVARRKNLRHAILGLGAILLTAALFAFTSRAASKRQPTSIFELTSFFSTVRSHDGSNSDALCPGSYGEAASHSGYVGLKDDTPDSPRRSFFW